MCYFAPLKKAIVDNEGVLWLTYWKGNEVLKKSEVILNYNQTIQMDNNNTIGFFDYDFNVEEGVILEGTIKINGKDKKNQAGLYLEYEKNKGSFILVGLDGKTKFGLMQPFIGYKKNIKNINSWEVKK